MVSQYNICKSIAFSITSSNGFNIIPLFENAIPENIDPDDVLSVNGFVKNLKAYAKITSIEEAPVPNILLEDSQPTRINKVLDIEWGSQRKELDVLLSSDGTSFFTLGTASLINQVGYPFKVYNLLDLLTDGLAFELGQDGIIAARIQNVGYGGLEESDVVNVYGSWVQEVFLKEQVPIYNINVTCNGGSGGGGETGITTGNAIVPVDVAPVSLISGLVGRKSLQLENTGDEVVFLGDASNEWLITLVPGATTTLIDFEGELLGFSTTSEGNLNWISSTNNNPVGTTVSGVYSDLDLTTFDETDWRYIPEGSNRNWVQVTNLETRDIDIKNNFYESYTFRIQVFDFGISPKFIVSGDLIFGISSTSTDFSFEVNR
jgi:hypothetical protein